MNKPRHPAPHVQAAVSAVQARPSPLPQRVPAPHVQAACRAVQAKAAVVHPPPPVARVPAPAPHVRANVAAVQKAPRPAERPAAPHVQAAQAGAIQRKPSNNNDPTGNKSGIYWDRKEMETVNGKNVPSRLTAIMKNPQDGGRPSVSPPGWDWLQTKVEKLKGNWVRFHIINQKLGGPGNKTWNLVPTSVQVNNTFNRRIEEPAKKSALTDKEWTYVDVELEYDDNWPAPIPKTIDAEWGSWDDIKKKWVRQDSLPSPLENPDITAFGKAVYHRGINITIKDAARRGVPRLQQRAFADWLESYSQGSEGYIKFWNEAKAEFGEESIDWMEDIYLDEDPDNPGRYVPVVKSI
jgi:hypothetical protein